MDSLAYEPVVSQLATPSPSEFLIGLRQQGPNRFDVATAFLDRGADINGTHEFRPHYRIVSGPVDPRTKVTALFDAAQRGDLDTVQFLLSKGADVYARNRTGYGLRMGLFPEYNAIETLCALDGMRTSKNMKIVQLAEELCGVETEEEFVKRRDAFDSLMPPGRWRPDDMAKSTKRRVKSVLSKESVRQEQTRQPQIKEMEDDRKQRYNLRPRKSTLFYG